MNNRTPSPSVQPSSLSRYTRFVHSTKMGLGFIALILAAVLLFYPLLREQNGGGVRISINTAEKKAPEPAVMKAPRFHGLDKNNQPYVLTADKATETVEDTVLLAKPAGEMITRDAQQIYVKANEGSYNKKQRTLLLKGGVEMMDSKGYRMQTEVLYVDVAGKSAVTKEMVTGQGELGTLKAYGGAQADSNSQRIFFEGPVFMTLKMERKTVSTEEKK